MFLLVSLQNQPRKGTPNKDRPISRSSVRFVSTILLVVQLLAINIYIYATAHIWEAVSTMKLHSLETEPGGRSGLGTGLPLNSLHGRCLRTQLGSPSLVDPPTRLVDRDEPRLK